MSFLKDARKTFSDVWKKQLLMKGMEKFIEFWEGASEKEHQTLEISWMEKGKNQLGEKVQSAKEFNIQGINVRTRIMKRKKLEAPGTDRWKMVEKKLVENVCFNVRCRLKNKNGLED